MDSAYDHVFGLLTKKELARIGTKEETYEDILNYRGLKPAGSSGQSATPRHDPCGLIKPILLTQFLSNLKDGASLLN